MRRETLMAMGFNNLEEFQRWYERHYRPLPPVEPPPPGWEQGEGLDEPFRTVYLAEAASIDEDPDAWEPPEFLLQFFSEDLLRKLAPRAKKAITYGYLRAKQDLYRAGRYSDPTEALKVDASAKEVRHGDF